MANDHHGCDYARNNDHCKCPENYVTPLNANPVTVPAVAATINLSVEGGQDEPFPEFPPASLDVIRLTAWALHGQESSPSLPEPLRVIQKCAPKNLIGMCMLSQRLQGDRVGATAVTEALELQRCPSLSCHVQTSNRNTGRAMWKDTATDGNPAGETARAMLDAFTSVGADQLDVTWTTRQGKKAEFRRHVPAATLRHFLPTAIASAEKKEWNVIVRPVSRRAVFIQLDDLSRAGVEQLKPDDTASHPRRRKPQLQGQIRAQFPPRAGGARHAGIDGEHHPARKHGIGGRAGEASVVYLPIRTQNRDQGRPDVSRADFTWCMTAISWDHGIEQTAARLMEESTRARENGEAYALLTAQNPAADARNRQRSRH
jgi:hypothetical protein